jgi:sporulation protein YlmC with PRC-barrel domain
MGNTVIDKAGKELGTVKDLLINQAAGRIEYIIMSYGGTLGIGEDDYSLPWKDVTLTTSDSEMVIQVNEAPIRDTQTSLGNRSSRN